jgi:hypothetical protein
MGDKNIKALLYVLFEYKNLWSRLPIYGQVYQEYIPQVKSGLADLGLPEMAIYMEQVTRICSLKEMLRFDASHNVSVHKPSPADKKPIGAGYMIVYANEQLHTIKDAPDGDLWPWIKKPGRDMGEIKYQRELHAILLAVKNGFFNVALSPISVNMDVLKSRSEFVNTQDLNLKTQTPTQILQDYKACMESYKGRVVGILPYKIMDLNIVPVEKEVGYTAKHAEAIDLAMDKVFELQKIEDMNDRQSRWMEMYGLVEEIIDVDFSGYS